MNAKYRHELATEYLSALLKIDLHAIDWNAVKLSKLLREHRDVAPKSSTALLCRIGLAFLGDTAALFSLIQEMKAGSPKRPFQLLKQLLPCSGSVRACGEWLAAAKTNVTFNKDEWRYEEAK